MPSEYASETLVQEFSEEAKDILQSLNTGVLEFEAAIDQGVEPSLDVVEDLFRGTHTLKGLASMFDFNSIRDLAHRLESIFDRVRKGVLTPDANTANLLFSSVDALSTAVMSASLDGVDEDSAHAASAELDRLLEAGGADTGVSTQLVDAELSEYARSRIEERAEGVEALSFDLRWGVELRLGLLRVSDIEDALEGEVVEVSPATGKIPALEEMDTSATDALVRVVVLTTHDVSDVAAALGISEGSITRASGRSAAASVPSGAPEERREAPRRKTGQDSLVCRVDIGRLDDLIDLAGELVTARTRLAELSTILKARWAKDDDVSDMTLAVKDVGLQVAALHELVMQMRLVPVDSLFAKFPRMVRDLAKNTGKELELRLEGGDTELDRRLIEQLEDPLMHILRNACDHGIESPQTRTEAGKPPKGVVRVEARHDGGHIVIKVSDDGAGLDLAAVGEKAEGMGLLTGEDATENEIMRMVLEAGLSTAAEVTEVSGRGFGLDIVAKRITDLGGSIDLDSLRGQGTLVTLRVPLTLAIIPALLVWIGNDRFAVPLHGVSEVMRVRTKDIDTVQGSPVFDLRGETLPLIETAELVSVQRDESRSKRFVVVARAAGQQFGLLVDTLFGQQDIVVKNLEQALGQTSGVSGATILGDGTVVPILDLDGIARLARETAMSTTQALGR